MTDDLPKAEPTEGRDWSKRPDSSRRCTAHKKTGEQCKNAARLGQRVCGYHGGKAGHSLKAARERLESYADRAAERLVGIAESDKVPAYVALQAVNSVLDRIGITEPKQVEVTVSTPFHTLIGDIESGSRSEYRRERGILDPEPQSPAIEAHHIPRPGGTLALGPGYVIDGEVETEADDDQDGPADARLDDDRAEAHRRATEALANRPLPLPPADGYLPTDIAMERVADANRNHRAQLRRR